MPAGKGRPRPSEVDKRVAAVLAEIYANQQEILRAFIAKYGCTPADIEQVIEFDPSTRQSIWYLRKKPPAL